MKPVRQCREEEIRMRLNTRLGKCEPPCVPHTRLDYRAGRSPPGSRKRRAGSIPAPGTNKSGVFQPNRRGQASVASIALTTTDTTDTIFQIPNPLCPSRPLWRLRSLETHHIPAVGLERHLKPELQQTARQNLGWCAPRRAIGVVDREDRAGIEGVVDVELRFNTRAADPEHAREPEIDLLDPVLVERTRAR